MTPAKRRPPYGARLAALLVVAGLGLGLVLIQGYGPRLGLDLKGGIAIVLRAEGEPTGEAMDKAVEIIRSRVDGLGIGEPEITRQGNDLIQVQIPGVQDPERAESVVGRTAQLSFRPVIGVATDTVIPQDVTGTSTVSRPSVTPPNEDDPAATVRFPLKESPDTVLILGPVALMGDQVTRADATLAAGSEVVTLEFTGEGEAAFKKITGELACNPQGDPKRQLAIVLDGIIESAPQMGTEVQCNQGISQGAQISTGSAQEARDLALVLRYGSLPVALTVEAREQVSPTVGGDALRAGLVAGGIGLALVMIYAVLYYRALGLVVIGGLLVFGTLIYVLVALLGESVGMAITLSGIAGLIVSIGITADSYIVYFERIKDEIRSGKSMRMAVERGFKGAYRTIIAADTVSLMAAGLLWLLTVGGVKGFAFFLGIATIMDLIMAWFFTQNVVALLAGSRLFGGGFLSLERAVVNAEDEEGAD